MQMTPFNSKSAIGLHGSGVVKSVKKQSFDQRRQGNGLAKADAKSPMSDFIASLGVSADVLGRKGAGSVMTTGGETHVREILQKLDPSLSADAANHATLPAEYRKKEEEDKSRRVKAKM